MKSNRFMLIRFVDFIRNHRLKSTIELAGATPHP